MPSVGYVRKAAEWNRRRYRRAWGPGIRTEPLTVTFPTTDLRSRCWIALGADLTQSYLSWNWLDITEWVRWEQGIATSSGRRDQSDRVEASAARLTIENDGRFSRRNPLGPYFGLLTRHTPIWLALDPGTGYADRYFGFVNEWPKRWDRSGTDSTVELTCGGIMRRIQRNQPLRSPMFYTISGASEDDYVPRVYIPLEDGENATRAASGLAGGTPANILGDITFASDTDLAGSAALPFLDSGSRISVGVPTYTDTNQWVVQIALRVDAEPGASATYLEVDTPGGSNVLWRLYIEPGSPSIIWWVGYDSSGATTGAGLGISLDGLGNPTEDDFYGRWWFYTLSTKLIGSDVFGGMSITDDGDFESSSLGGVAGTHAPATAMRILAGEGVAAGHLALFTDPTFNINTDAYTNAAAMGAWDGEQAHERMRRLCREQRIPFFCQALSSTTLGPQPTGKLIDVLRDAEKADQGVLYEHQFGFGYQTLAERYNRPVVFELDIAQGQLAEDPEPEDNDLRIRNQWTANRRDGSSATVQGRDGFAGVELEPTEALYEAEETFGVETDDQVTHLASWLVHRDSLDEDYWPNIGINLAHHPELIEAWLQLGYGERMTVDNVMTEAGIDQLDLMIEGREEFWNSKVWRARMNTSPAKVFTVFQLDDEVYGRLDSGSSTLTSDVAAGASSFSVTTSDAADLWTTDSAQFPFDIKVAGIDIEVTGISGSSSPQTFTVTGADVVKALSAGEEVHIAVPVVLAL